MSGIVQVLCCRGHPWSESPSGIVSPEIRLLDLEPYRDPTACTDPSASDDQDFVGLYQSIGNILKEFVVG